MDSCEIVKLKKKLDGVGPVDSTPPTDRIHYFPHPPPKKKIIIISDMGHVTCDE